MGAAWRIIREAFGDMPASQTIRARLIVHGVSVLFVFAMLGVVTLIAWATR
jgi:hypothetical protein